MLFRSRNLAPAFVWIAWWIGFTYLSALVGDVWTVLSPWKALYPAGRSGLRRELPAAVGVWPAAALLLAFAWIEIVWEGNAVPANIAWLALGYSVLTWTGMFVFGRDAWLSSGEVFAVYFGMLAKLAPGELRADALDPRVRIVAGLDGLVFESGAGWEVRFGGPERFEEKLALARSFLREDPERRLEYLDVRSADQLVFR